MTRIGGFARLPGALPRRAHRAQGRRQPRSDRGAAAPSPATLSPTVQACDARFPDLAPSERHFALIGFRCADVVAGGADPQAVARAQIAFVSAL